MPSICKDKLLRIEVKKKDRCRIRIGVKEVKVVIGVRVNSKRSAYLSEKIRVKSRRKAQLKMKN